jgi:DNA polymerase V
LLQQIFKAGFRYQQCGVQLSDIRPESTPGQIDLFEFSDQALQDNSTALMKTMDQINRRFHKRAITLAATGLDQRWQVKIENVSSR